jgi:hypothetical protein
MWSKVDDELNRLRSWSRADQWKLLQGLVEMLRQGDTTEPQPRHKAQDFRGVGREAWKDVDVEEYLREERASWDNYQKPSTSQENAEPLHDIREFRGIGHGTWEALGGVDKFIRQERSSWRSDDDKY